MINILDDYSIKHHDLDASFESGESEFPDSKNSLQLKLIYDKNKFINCPESYLKIWKQFYQHDPDKLLLSEKIHQTDFWESMKGRAYSRTNIASYVRWKPK